jgi:hypothetical protein
VISRVYAHFMEPRGAVGIWDSGEDRFTLSADVQYPHRVRQALAASSTSAVCGHRGALRHGHRFSRDLVSGSPHRIVAQNNLRLKLQRLAWVVMPSLWDIEQLRPLRSIGTRFGVEFRLRGGTAFRFAAANGRLHDLFSLVPFTSDVDLMHSGPPALTELLLNEIHAQIFAAECFRWELSSEREVRSTFSAAATQSNIVPARLIEFTGQVPDGLVDPAGGGHDIDVRKYRYYRNPLFRRSQLYRRGRDLEAFSAMLYLQTLAEADIPIADHDGQPGWQAISDIFGGSASDWEVTRLLQEHAYLRSRFRHLLLAAAAAYPKRADFLDVAKRSGLSSFVSAISGLFPSAQSEQPLRSFFGDAASLPSLTFVESDRLKGDSYRIEQPEGPWTTLVPSTLTLPVLGEHQTLLLVSPRVWVAPGTRAGFIGSAGVPLDILPQREFVCFQLPEEAVSDSVVQATADVADENLSAFLMLEEGTGWTPFALPCLVRRPRPGAPAPAASLSIVMNCLGLLALAAKTSRLAAHVALVAWSGSD